MQKITDFGIYGVWVHDKRRIKNSASDILFQFIHFENNFN